MGVVTATGRVAFRVKDAETAPAGTVPAQISHAAVPPASVMGTAAPPAGAGPVSTTRPLAVAAPSDVLAPMRSEGLMVKAARDTTAGGVIVRTALFETL